MKRSHCYHCLIKTKNLVWLCVGDDKLRVYSKTDVRWDIYRDQESQQAIDEEQQGSDSVKK